MKQTGPPATGTPRAVQRQRWIGWGLLLLLVALIESFPPLRLADLALHDLQWQVLRRLGSGPTLAAADEPVVIGIDEASLDAVAEPLALWHRPLAELCAALAAAGPRGVLLDVALPERSFDAVLPGSDAALLGGLRELSRAAPLVVAQMLGPDAQPRPVMAALRAVAAPRPFVPALLPLDRDDRVRRLAVPEAGGPSLAQALVDQLKLPAPPALKRPSAEVRIDYALGQPFTYLPLHAVLEAQRQGRSEQLRAWFGGRIVLIGSVLAFTDRIATPVPLAAWEPGAADAPGVLIHAQTLRTLLAGRAVEPVPAWLWLALALAATTLWWLPPAPVRSTLLMLGLCAALFVVSTLGLALGHWLAPFTLARLVLLALGKRLGLDTLQAWQERSRLRSAFGGYVSPEVLQRLLDGRLDPTRPDGPRTMAFLFADLRGFTTRGQSEAALATVHMLNRYYDAIIGPIHAHGGMVDNFRGDGIMVVFGAPQPLEDPARAAVLAAGGMVRALAELNQRLAAEGHEPLRMGLGLAMGEAVAGEIGSRERHDYTAIGDAVNVAARLQDLCKPYQAQAVATQAMAQALQPGDADIHDLGAIELRGHTPVPCCRLAWPEAAAPAEKPLP